MQKDVERYIGRQVMLTYLDRNNRFSQRVVYLQSVKDGRVRAFDRQKNAPRVFLIDNIMAVLPVRDRVG